MKDAPPDVPDDVLIDELLADEEAEADSGDPLESEHMPAPRLLRLSPRRRFERIRQRENLTAVLPGPPAPGESVHLVGNALYDFWTFVPVMIDWLGRTERLYCSTWTLSRSNAVEMFGLWDGGVIGQVAFLTGLYFKRRESAVYTLLLNGILRRHGRYVAFKNHCKVLLLDNAERDAWITVEGSANLTANPRLEQYVITNDRSLWEFHREWMEECLTTRDK